MMTQPPDVSYYYHVTRHEIQTVLGLNKSPFVALHCFSFYLRLSDAIQAHQGKKDGLQLV